MSGGVEQQTAAVVSRYFERCAAGESASVDDLLDTLPPGVNRDEVKSRALQTIAQRLSQAPGGADPSSPEAPTFAGQSSAGSPRDLSDVAEFEGYEILSTIGRGGMGLVYEAMQHSTGRRVALKVMLTWSGGGDAAKRRFEREVELVARLQHPNIVAVYDSGIHKGRCFCVMEYVEGKPLDEAVRPGEHDVREVMRLLATLCDAVEYAHERGVLHRDLKPSNILIDQRGEPRLLDFGLAKAIDPEGGAGYEASLSEPGQLLGTLGYMPPEQSRGRTQDVSVRTDVYSLGAIGYELVTGRLPCAVEGSLSQILQRIEEITPPAPSSIRQGVPKDVDAILLKALEKPPNARYASAKAMAEDIRRFLENRPITARPIGPGQRAVRWVKRNRKLSTVAGAALAIVLLTGAAAVVQIQIENWRTKEAIDVQQAATTWMDTQMASLSASEGLNFNVTAEELQDRVAQRLEMDPPSRPRVRAAVHARLGKNYLDLKRIPKAEKHYREALALRRTTLEPPHSDLAQSLHDLAAALWWKHAYEEAEPLYRDALRMRRTLFDANAPEIADTINHLGATMRALGRYREAEEFYREALRIRRASADGPDEDVASSLNSLAKCLMNQGKLAEAEPMLRESLDIIRALRGADDIRVATVEHNLAECLVDQGRFDEAAALLNEALRIKRLRQGRGTTAEANSLHVLGRAALGQGSTGEAERLFRLALEIRRARPSEDRRDVAQTLALLGQTLILDGRAAEAVGPLEEAAQIREDAAIGPHFPAEARVLLALAHHVQGQPAASAEALAHGVAKFRESLAEHPRARALEIERLASLLADVGFIRGAAALRDLLQEVTDVDAAPSPPRTVPEALQS